MVSVFFVEICWLLIVLIVDVVALDVLFIVKEVVDEVFFYRYMWNLFFLVFEFNEFVWYVEVFFFFEIGCK